MDSRFRIFHKGCNLSIYGLEQNGDEYAYEDYLYGAVEGRVSPSFRQFKYSESVTINAIYSVDSNNNDTLIYYDIVPHDDRVDQTDYTLAEDGLYNIHHIILPTKGFVDALKNLQSWEDLKNSYSVVYYYDNDNFYAYYPETEEEKIIEDVNIILEINDDKSSIVKSSQTTFNICHLEKCLYQLIKNAVDQSWGKCKTVKVDKLKRDILWMSLYVIKYLNEYNQFIESQRILESLKDCGILCSITNKYNNNDCGCSNN